MIKLEIDTLDTWHDYAGIQKVFKKALNVLGKEVALEGKKVLAKIAGKIVLVFVDDQEIKTINKHFRGINKPTDVVSISYLEANKFPGDDLLGEIFISIDTAKRQASEAGHGLRDEVDFLFVHGVLHVFGFDHMTEAEQEKMFAVHEKILAIKG